MNGWITISPDQQGHLPILLFLASFAVVAIILVLYGLKKKFPLTPWLLVIFTTLIFAIIGGKILSFSLDDWQSFLSGTGFPETQSKTVLGYLIFGLLGMFLAKKVLKFKHPIGDAFAYAWPVGLIVSRLGCFIGGCCYGVTTKLPVGIHYAQGSSAINEHMHHHLISADALKSLAVHPTQLYEVLFCLLLLGGIHFFATKKLFKAPGNLFFASILTYSIFRFFEEFIRHGGEFVWGLKTAQYAVLFIAIFMLGIIWINERRFASRKTDDHLQSNLNPKRQFIAYSVLLFLIVFTSNWLTPSELLIAQSIGFLSFGFLTILFLQELKSNSWQQKPIVLSLLALMLMSQTLNEPIDSSLFQRKFFTVSAGASLGEEEEICGGTNDYQSIGLSIEHTNQTSQFNKFSFGSQFYSTNYNGTNYGGINPFVKLDTKYFAGGLGISYQRFESAFRTDGLIPSISLRLGRQDKFFLDGHYGDYFPAGIPAFQVGLGIGMEKYPDSYLRMGISEGGFYLNPRFRLNEEFCIDTQLGYGSENSYHLGLKLHFYIYHE